MSPEQWQRVKEVVGAALELEAERRGQFLEQECGADRELRRAVDALLEGDQRAGQTIEGAIAAAAAQVAQASGRAGKNLQAGQTISHYQVIEKLGEGGMGVVYKAEDTKLERSVALKFLAVHAIEDPEHKARFIREAKAAARLDHQNICPVYEIDEVEGQTFLAMAYLEGRTVKDKIAERPLKLDEALDIAIQIAQGLKAAHEKEIIHRDIKAANLMLTKEGQIKIMDFGLAQLAEGSKLTKTRTLLGTPAYMSPEQARREPTDRRTDVWSLGVVIYEMVTSRLPFEGGRQEAVLHAIGHEEPEPVTAIRSGLPTELDRILEKALAKNLDERYQHVEDMLVDLRWLQKKLASGKLTIAKEGVLSGLAPPRARDSETKGASFGPGLARERLAWLFAAFGFVGILVLVFVHFRQIPPAPPLALLHRFSFTVPVAADNYLGVAISPNGKRVAISDMGGGAMGGGIEKLWVKDLESGQLRAIEGIERAGPPFWSPGSDFIGFVDGRELKKVSAEGGPSIRVCQMPVAFGDGSWSPDGDSIVFRAGQSSGGGDL